MKIFLILILLIIITRITRGYYTSNVERPLSTTVQTYDTFEIRQLPEQIIATITVNASDESQAAGRGFQALAGFIFGDNTRRESIAMTAPVTSTETSQPIAMTAPVTSASNDDGTYEVAFIMPSERTIDTLPVPNNDIVKISTQPSSQIAVWTFGGYARSENVAKQKIRFQQALEQTNITTQGTFTLAQYNDPRTPPRMRTNELRVPVE